MKEQITFVPEYKFLELGEALQVMNLSERKPITKTVFWHNIEIVPTGAIGSGDGKTWQSIDGHRIVKLEYYKGELKPLEYSEHHHEVELGRRERGYTGQLVKYNKQKYVFCEKYIFKQIKKQDIQTHLF